MSVNVERKEKTYKLEEVIQEALRDYSTKLYCCLPGKIASYDTAKQSATVEIMLKKKYTFSDDSGTDRPSIQDVPVHYHSGNAGGKFLHIPVKKGDLGMLMFCDRSLDLYLASDGATKILPGDTRTHDISDAFFIPGVNPFQKALAGVNADDVILKNENVVLTFKNNGTLTLDNGRAELIAVLNDLTEWLKTKAKVLTQAGPQPFTADALATLAPIIENLESFKVE